MIKQILYSDTRTIRFITNKDLLQQTEGSHAQLCAHTVILLSRLITWTLCGKLRWGLNVRYLPSRNVHGYTVKVKKQSIITDWTE